VNRIVTTILRSLEGEADLNIGSYVSIYFLLDGTPSLSMPLRHTGE